MSEHNYIVYKIIPEAYPCSGIRGEFTDKDIEEAIYGSLERIRKRNKACLSEATYEKLSLPFVEKQV